MPGCICKSNGALIASDSGRSLYYHDRAGNDHLVAAGDEVIDAALPQFAGVPRFRSMEAWRRAWARCPHR